MSKFYAVKRIYEDGREYESKLYLTKSGIKSSIRYHGRWNNYIDLTKIVVLEYDLVPNRVIPIDQFMSEKKTGEAYNVWSADTESRYYKSTIEQALDHYRKEHGLNESDTLIWEKISVISL